MDYTCACACLLLLSREAFPFNELVQCPGGSSATDSVVPQKWLSGEMTLGLLHGGWVVWGGRPGPWWAPNSKFGREVWVKFFFLQMVGTNLGKCEWVWEEKLRWLNPRWWNSRWQNSRWLPSSSWVRMNEFESDWISLSQSQSGVRVFLSESERRKQGVWIQHGRSWIQHGGIQDGCHHQVEGEWMSLSQIKLVLSQSQSGVRVFLSESERRKQGVWIQHGRIQDGCHHQVESEWMSEVFFNPTWQNSRWLPLSSWVRMNEWSFFVQVVGREVWVKFFFCKWWEPTLASMSEFQRKN